MKGKFGQRVTVVIPLIQGVTDPLNCLVFIKKKDDEDSDTGEEHRDQRKLTTDKHRDVGIFVRN